MKGTTLRYLSTVAVGVVLLLNSAHPTKSQPIPPELSSNIYVMSLLDMIDRWNENALDLPRRDELRDEFRANLERSIETNRFEYENEQWFNRSLERFETLPEAIEPELQFSDPAIQILVLNFAQNIRDIRERLEPEQIESQIPATVFVLFSTSQLNAIEDNSSNIGPNHVVSALFSWWTRVWPFCPQ